MVLLKHLNCEPNCRWGQFWRSHTTVNKGKENANNTKENDGYTFVMQHEVHSKIMCEWIMDLQSRKHIISHKLAFDIYEAIAPFNVYLGEDNIVKEIKMHSNVAKAIIWNNLREFISKIFSIYWRYNTFALSEQFLSNGLKVSFNLNEFIVKRSKIKGHYYVKENIII